MKMNRTVKLLILSDIFVVTGFGLIDPILAIFIKDNLQDGTIFAAGLGSALFLFTKSVVQLPFSRYVDKHDFNEAKKWLILGTLLIAAVPFIYIFSKTVLMIYIAQIIHGFASGLAYPTWLGLWSTNLDKNQESFEWSLYSTLTGIGTAIAGAIGAAIAGFIGFEFTFVFVGILSICGCLILLSLKKNHQKIDKTNLITHP